MYFTFLPTKLHVELSQTNYTRASPNQSVRLATFALLPTKLLIAPLPKTNRTSRCPQPNCPLHLFQTKYSLGFSQLLVVTLPNKLYLALVLPTSPKQTVPCASANQIVPCASTNQIVPCASTNKTVLHLSQQTVPRASPNQTFTCTSPRKQTVPRASTTQTVTGTSPQTNCTLRFHQPNCSWHLFQTNGTLSLYQPNFFLHLFQTNCTLHLSKLFRAPFVNKLHLALSAPKTTVLYAFPNKLFSHLS